MTTRRDALTAALALLTEASASAQNKSGEGDRGPVFVHDLPKLTMDDWQVTVSEVPYPPGRVGQIHHHAGFRGRVAEAIPCPTFMQWGQTLF